MTDVHVESALTDGRRRELLFEGDVFLFSPTPESLALVEFARSMLEEAFSPHDPCVAQYDMPVVEFVQRFAPVKPAFIHHPRTRELLRDVLSARGCDPEDTYLDVPRLRGVTSDGYLTAGVGYAHHAHRDTWYSAPLCQLNWWLPVYDFAADSGMFFYPRYWAEGIANGSDGFDYYDWNARSRKDAAKHIHTDTRWQPRADEDVDDRHPLRFVCPVGGTILFSPAHLHGTVPNTTGRTRFSIDFRTVSLSDLLDERAAPNVDSRPRGTSLRDFLRTSDGAPLPDEVVASHESGSPAEGVLVFDPDS